MGRAVLPYERFKLRDELVNTAMTTPSILFPARARIRWRTRGANRSLLAGDGRRA
jgi:hypothetical protein